MSGPRDTTRGPSAHRLNAVLATGTTLLGLWFGLAAPAVSPVGPPASTVPAVVSEAAGTLAPPAQAAPTAPTAPTAPAAPTAPTAPAQAGGPQDGNRRDDAFQGRDDGGQQGRHR